MSLTFGFYNSLNGDRKYNAEQVSAIFDGLIHDGVFDSIGDHFAVTPGEGLQVIVGTGKAWFHHTWNVNDAGYPISIDPPDLLLPRIDAVVLEINNQKEVRTNSFKMIKGNPASVPQKPIPTNTDIEEGIHQYVLAYITVSQDTTQITSSKIEINVGKSSCPFVTSIVQSTDIDALFNQWEGEFDEWFENIKLQLTEDVVSNLQYQIDERVKIADKATIAEAKEGTNDNHWMTPKAVKDFFDSKIIIGDEVYPNECKIVDSTDSYSSNLKYTKDYMASMYRKDLSSTSFTMVLDIFNKKGEFIKSVTSDGDGANVSSIEFQTFTNTNIILIYTKNTQGERSTFGFFKCDVSAASPVITSIWKPYESLNYGQGMTDKYCVMLGTSSIPTKIYNIATGNIISINSINIRNIFGYGNILIGYHSDSNTTTGRYFQILNLSTNSVVKTQYLPNNVIAGTDKYNVI